MSHTPHELHDEFPDRAEKIHQLKSSNPHFAGLAEAYSEVNHSIQKMESGLEPVADEVLELAKKRRLALLDEINALLAVN